MSNLPWLNGLATAVSLFNTILLLWLGLTVLLNSERRRWGIGLAGGGLLAGAVFFFSHTTILGLDLVRLNLGMLFWWTVGLIPAIACPFIWYVTMLWYAGYWEDRQAPLARRQRPWLRLTVAGMLIGLAVLGAGILMLLVPASRFVPVRLTMRTSVANVPLLALAYSAYVILCIALSLDALLRPGPSARAMGQLARRRARLWFAAASVMLLVVSLVGAGVILWLVQATQAVTLNSFVVRSGVLLAALDLLLSALVASAILLIGQAVVAYEVFTGQTLPRRGLARLWRQAVILALTYSALVGLGVGLGWPAIYTPLLATLLVAILFALFSWRAFADRERSMAQLRPFVASQQMVDRVTEAEAPVASVGADSFAALCADVLEASRAYLTAVGPFAPFVPTALAYPDTWLPAMPPLGALTEMLGQAETTVVALDAAAYDGAEWAVSLWSRQGLCGVLFLGPKEDGGLYTQEEMALARVGGERLLDGQAGAEMSRRLMALQRSRLVESQMADLRARQVLHDEILPDLQAALIRLGGADPAASELLSQAHRRIADLLHQMPTATTAEVVRLGFLPALKQAVNAELAPAFDSVTWEVEPVAKARAARLPPVTAEVLFHAAREAVRNAARHGRAGGDPLNLTIRLVDDGGLVISVEDDGVGLARETIRDGHGLALHSTMLAVVGGSLTVDGNAGVGSRVKLRLAAM